MTAYHLAWRHAAFLSAGLSGLMLLAFSLATLSGCMRSTEDSEKALEEALKGALQPRDPDTISLWPIGHLAMTGSFELQLGPERWKVSIKRDSWVRDDGAMHLVDERRWSASEQPGTPEALIEDKQDRFEGIFDGHVWVTRTGYGPWIQRDSSDGHHIRTQIRVRDWLPTLVRAFGGRVGTVATAEPVEVFGGRSGIWRRLVLQPRADGVIADKTVLAGLRDDERTWPSWVDATHVPDRVSGRIAVDEDHDEVYVGEMTVSGVTEVRGSPGRFEASAKHTWTALEPDVSFELPATYFPDNRERVWPMIREVLGDALTETWGGPATPVPAP